MKDLRRYRDESMLECRDGNVRGAIVSGCQCALVIFQLCVYRCLFSYFKSMFL